ncbi:hypothetical protein LPLM1_00112 [Listeria phage LPML1]|nr:hypothetical protein LPLM1_00112 [Listeria phage LPML1]
MNYGLIYKQLMERAHSEMGVPLSYYNCKSKSM